MTSTRAATSSDVRTESFSKSTRTTIRESGSAYSANFVAARTVLPPYEAISECGTVPMPRPPHHEACASDVTPISTPIDAPATCAAYPSPVCTRWWSWRAGMKMIGLPFAASTTRRTFVEISVRRARTPR